MSGHQEDRANLRQAVPFFWVRAIEQTVRFYVDGLGFAMTKSWVDRGKLRWCWLERGGAAVMLQELWRDGQHANEPVEKLGEGVPIAFLCEDAPALYRELRLRGVDASLPQVGNGMWVTELADPDGYRLFFESATDSPEGTQCQG
jgi:catechol 2,3-dioxygenase-like lactoylglutathione lyase family enzyme